MRIIINKKFQFFSEKLPRWGMRCDWCVVNFGERELYHSVKRSVIDSKRFYGLVAMVGWVDPRKRHREAYRRF